MVLTQSKCEQKRQQLGLAGSSIPVSVVTLYVLDGLAMELKNLEAEQVDRQKRLDLRMKVSSSINPLSSSKACMPHIKSC